MSITSAQVKDLREKTGAGMMDCKKALTEANGDMEKASEFLRKRGIDIAAKKGSRVAADGLIGYQINEESNLGILVEINCETDFVTKTDDFKNYVSTVTNLVKEKDPKNLDDFFAITQDGKIMKDLETELIAKIGEKLGVRRFARWEAKANAKLAQYIHPGDKIGVMVLINDPNNKLDNTKAREVAMHIAAMSPAYVRSTDVPESVIAKEKEIVISQMAGQKKPPEILDKIATGKVNKFFTEVCLENQIFVRDLNAKLTVAKTLTEIDSGIKIDNFIRFQVGEGIEKK